MLDKKPLDDFLKAKNLPGVVALITSPSETLYESAFGYADTTKEVKATIDTPHAIMSMTKPITSCAIMKLHEQGKLSLDDEISNYLEEYKLTEVLSEVDLETKEYSTKPLSKKPTIKNLLNHTSGYGYRFSNHTLRKICKMDETEFSLLHKPGEKWTYGASTKILGDLVSKVEGEDLEQSLKRLVLDPLGMNETSFKPRENQAVPHRLENGSWVSTEKFPRIDAGDGGLISTVKDYEKFLRCFLNKGDPILSAEMVKEMTTNQIGDLWVETQPDANPALTCPFPLGGGEDKFGLGFQIHMSEKENERAPGSFSWCGLMNTFFWVDPRENIACVLFMQTLPLYDPTCIETVKGFERILYRGL